MSEQISMQEQGAITIIDIPLHFKRRSGRREIILPPDAQPQRAPTPLLMAVAKAFKWQKMLDDGQMESISELARTLGLSKVYVARILRLTLLAPDLVEAILNGREPEGLNLNVTLQPLPLLWEEQRKLFDFPCQV